MLKFALIFILIILLLILNKKNCESKKELFSMSTKPFEVENSLLNRNVWDDIDYQIPVFIQT
jgi:hypothetical protein